MKQLSIFLLSFLIAFTLFAQSPGKMSYQAVIRNAGGELVKNTTVGMRISILQGDINGTAVYSETQTPSTNINGLVTLVIGDGKVISGNMASIDWSNGPYFIKTETDLSADRSGGASYTITGTSQLLSVPYALHATTAESLTNPPKETDPVFEGSVAGGITQADTSNWNKKMGGYTESDPVYGRSTAKGITQTDTANWNRKLTGETDPVFSAWDKSSGIKIKESQITDLKHFTSSDETDPIFGKSVAKGISKTDTVRWNGKSSFSGNYNDLSNKPTNISSFNNDAGYQKVSDDGDTDPTNEIQSIYRSGDKIGISNGGWVSMAQVETDPVCSAWDKSSGISITESQISNLKHFTNADERDPKYASDSSYIKSGIRSWNSSLSKKINSTDTTRWGKAETDPVFSGSQAANITATDITHLSHLSGTNTGDQDLSGLATKTALRDTAEQLRSEIPDVSGFLSTETDPVYSASQAVNITDTDITNLSHLSGRNTGDQDLSGYATTSTVTAGLATKVDKVAGKGLSTEDYTTDEKAQVSNLSGVNTGDETTSTIKSKLGITTLSGSNTGDQDLSGYATTSTVTVGLAAKVDKVAGKGLSTEDYTTAEKTKVSNLSGVNTGDETTSTIKSKLGITTLSGSNTGDQDLSGYATTSTVTTGLAAKVDKVTGKGLSTEDYTTAEKTKLAGLSSTTVDFTGSLDGDVTGTQSATVVTTVGGQTAASVAAATASANAATSANTANTIVKRDASGNFSAGTVTANIVGNVTGSLTGNASTATFATTAQALSGQYTDWNATTGGASIANKPTINGSETKVTAGANITITGSGTNASPYVINTCTSMTQEQRDALTPVAGLMVYNTSTNKPNYHNGTEWMNYDGTSAKTIFAIGVSYLGGIIAYILQPGDPGYDANVTHGIIAAPNDQGTAAGWGCEGGTITGADGTAIGTGAQNTIDIVAGCTTAGIAAKLCADLVLGGYSDWYLPSKDELNALYQNREAIAGFSNDYYWSSSEATNNYAWTIKFDVGRAFTNNSKSNPHYVRAVRAF